MIGDTVNHYGIIRMRVQGSGELKLTLMSLPDESDIQEQFVCPSIVLPNQRKFPTVLSDYKSMGAQLEIRTTEIDEVFQIGMISIYSIPIATTYPT